MKTLQLVLAIFIVGCGSQPQTPPTKTLTCYDYESCRRSCYSYDKKEACKSLWYYKSNK